MNNHPISIYFDWGGNYAQTGNEFEWISGEDGRLYSLLFKTMEEMTYSLLVDRICRKIKIDEGTKLELSYFPLVVNCQKPSYIIDDEDVYVYLISLDREQRRSVLHVEVLKSMEIVPFQLSRAERQSSYGVNDDALNSSVGGNDGGVNVNGDEEPLEQPHEQFVENGNENNVDYMVDNSLGNEDISGPSEYVDLPHSIQDSQFVDEWEDGLGLVLGQEFESKQTVQQLVEKASHQNCFGFSIANSDTNRYVVRCREAKKGCKWYLRVAKLKNSTCFSVRVYTKFHTCSRTTASTSSVKKGTRRLVASILHEDYPGQLETPKPKNLIGLVQGRIGVEVSYSTALRGKKQALMDIRGSPEDSFRKLYSYLYVLEQANPGTKTSLVVDEDKRFKYLFVALGACIEGFAAMRKVIIVDATFLKTVHGGVLIFATAQDPNHHHYPIAFAVVDGEKDASWMWFFNTLKTIIPDNPELVFISDRNASLIKAVGEVYPISHHGYCTFHLSQNVRNKVSHVKKETVAAKFREIAQIYTEVEFEHQYADYRRRYPSVAEYLDASVEVTKWARCYFPGARYNINTTNSAESMNSVFNNARKYSLLPMIDAIIGKWAEWFNKHRNDSVAGSDAQKLVPFVENILHDRCIVASKLTVTELNTFQLEYRVDGRDGKNYLVDLKNKTCSCKCFDIDRYPCVHAIAAAKKCLMHENRPTYLHDYYDLCSRYYLVEQWALAYTRTIYPVPHMSEWIIPDEIQGLYVLPPKYVKRKGRLRETRFPSVGESRRRNKSVPGRNVGAWFTSGGTSED